MQDPRQTLLQAEHISYNCARRQIVSDVSLRLHPREIITVIGPNGSGKTTLAKLLLGILKPSSGSINRQHGANVGYVPQAFSISPILPITVANLLDYGLHDAGSKAEKLSFAAELGLNHLLPLPAQTISGGELQRVLLARALLSKPQILILDEPTQGLDVSAQVEFYQLIARMKTERNMSILLISHDLHFVMRATDRVICLHQHICCEGTPADVSKHPSYMQLFGKDTAETMAVYAHSHDHRH